MNTKGFPTYERDRATEVGGARRWCSIVVAGWASLARGAAGIAVDWNRYRGAHTGGGSPETIRTDWPMGAPNFLWRVPTSAGLTWFVPGEGKVFTVVARTSEARGTVFLALDTSTSNELLATPTGTAK